MTLTEPYLWTIFDDAPIGIALISQDGIFLRANPSLQKMLGYTEEELQQMSPLEITHPDYVLHDHKIVLDPERSKRSERSVLQVERQYIRKDGALVWGHVTGMTIDFENTPIFVATIKDITYEKALQSQKKFDEKISSLERIASAVTHDFRNILSLIDLNVTLANISTSDDTSKRSIEKIATAVERGNQLIDEITRMTSSPTDTSRPVRLDRFVNDISDDLRQITNTSITIDFLLDDQVSPIEISDERLEEILFTLVSTLQYALHPPATLTIEVADQKIDQHSPTSTGTLLPGTYAVLSIRDSNIDTDTPDLDEPFYTTTEINSDIDHGLNQLSINVRRAGAHLLIEHTPDGATAHHIYFPTI